MIKRYKLLLAVTSVVILLPIIAGLILWSSLPDSIAIHWNVEGEADGFAGKAYAVFALPAFLLAIHWVCTLVTSADPKSKDINDKPMALMLWVCPMISILTSTLMYGTSMGYNLSIELIMPLFMGALFVVVGNYMPKCKQNYTIGLKVPWTLNDEENWNKTHRFAGMVWVAGGIIVMLTAFTRTVYVMLAILLIMAFIPIVYSYILYRSKNK